MTTYHIHCGAVVRTSPRIPGEIFSQYTNYHYTNYVFTVGGACVWLFQVYIYILWG